jgi:HAMP domain-containing protein
MRKPPFAWRVFILAFVPVCGVLVGSFTAVRMMMGEQVKEGLRNSLRQTHEFLVRTRAAQELQNTRILGVIAENPALKAGFALMRTAGAGSEAEARRTLEDQITGISQSLGFDLVLATDEENQWMAGIARQGQGWKHVRLESLGKENSGLMRLAGRTYTVTAIPVNLAEENLGSLAVGRVFDFSEFTTPAVLTHNGRVVESNVAGADKVDVQAALAGCGPSAECELRVGGETYLSLPVQKLNLGKGYAVRSLQSVDAASVPMERVMARVLLLAGPVAVLVLVGVSFVAAKSVVRPLTDLAARLSESHSVGDLKPVRIHATTREVEALAQAFNLEFIQSMASAIDARDLYTAGHSFDGTEDRGAGGRIP